MKGLHILRAAAIGFLIGYFTNWIALRMLFYPKKRFLGIQGMLPKYQNVFADKTIDFIFKFIDFDEIITEAIDKKAFSSAILDSNWGIFRRSIGYLVAADIEHWLENENIRKYVAKNLSELTPQAKIVLARRIAGTNIDHLSNLILKGTSKEMNFLKLVGGIMGCIISVLNEILPW